MAFTLISYLAARALCGVVIVSAKTYPFATVQHLRNSIGEVLIVNVACFDTATRGSLCFRFRRRARGSMHQRILGRLADLGGQADHDEGNADDKPER